MGVVVIRSERGSGWGWNVTFSVRVVLLVRGIHVYRC